jgi:uncharacterized protein DUF6343
MPVNPQPRGRRGTVGHAYSPLNLRLALAVFGLVLSAAFAALFFHAGLPFFGWLFIVLAATAAVDIVVIQLRRRARHDGHHSLFE